MTEAVPVKKNRSWLVQWLIGIFFTALAIFLLSRVIRFEDLKAAFSSISLENMLLAALVYLVSMFVRAWGWQTLLQRRVSLWRSYLVINEGYFLNNIFPFRLGELGRAYLMGRRIGTGILNVLPTVIVERAYDLVYAASMLLLSIPFVIKMDWARPLALLVLGLIVAGLFALYLAARHRGSLEKWLAARAERVHFIQRWVLPSFHNILDGFAVLTRFDLFLISLFALGLSWGMAVFRDLILLRSLVPTAPVWWATLAIGASNLGGALPSMAASIGTFEGAATGALSLAGAAPEVGLAYALVLHGIHLAFTTVVGLVGISQEGESLGVLVQKLRFSK